MERRFLVYSLCDPRDGTVRYIGRTVQPLKKRLTQHMCDSRRIKNNHKVTWIRSLGGILPNIDVIEECLDESALEEAEAFYVDYFRFVGADLVNHEPGGKRASHPVRSAQSRSEQSIRMRGRILSEGHKKNISKGLAGRQFSLEVRNKISLSNRGKLLSPEHRENISKAKLGSKLSPEHKAHIADSVRRTLAANRVLRFGVL